MYNIRYFDDITGEELFSPIKIMNFEYKKNQPIPKKVFQQALKTFLEDILEIKNNRNYYEQIVNDGEENLKSHLTHIVKLGYLYLDLIEYNCFMFPFVFVPHKFEKNGILSCAGKGRLLIAGKYFPDLTHDITIHSPEYGIGSTEICHKYLDLVFKNSYWKDVNLDLSNKGIVLLLENLYSDPKDPIYNIKAVDIVNKNDFNNIPKTNYFESFAKKCNKNIIWNKIKGGIFDFKLKTLQDVFDLIDFIVLDNLDIFEKLYTWKFESVKKIKIFHNEKVLNCSYIKHPTPFIVGDNYCDNYEELEKIFPDKFLMKPEIDKIDNSVYVMNGYDYQKGPWKNFIDYHTSKEYFEKTCLVIQDQLIRWRPKLWEKIKSGNYTYGYQDHNKENDNEFDIFCKFLYTIDTEYMNNHGLKPHVDDKLKIFQLMVYFKHPEDNSSDGNLHTCNVKSDNSICNRIKCNYIQNRFVILPHTPSGWHFVSPSNNKYDRKMVNVIFEVNKELQEIDSQFFGKKL